MRHLLLCCTSAFWLSHPGLAGAVDYSLGDFRLAPIEDPYSTRFQGGSTEVTKEKVAQAIRFVGAAKEWKVASEADGRMELTTLVRGQHEVWLEVSYDATAYSVRYLRSSNLLYKDDLRPGVRLRVIHKNYNGWVKGLVTAINNSIGVPVQVSAGFAPLNDVNAVPFLREKAREAYREFLDMPQPRAFAIAPNGAWGRDSYYPSSRRDVIDNALERCQRRGEGACRIYALDSRVVWAPPRAPAP